MRRWYKFHRDLGLQLLALYLLLIIPFLLTLWIFDGLVGQRIREDVQTSDLSLAQAIAQETDLSIGTALNMVAGLASYPGVVAADIPSMEGIFQTILNTRPDVNLVYRLDASGRMFYHYPTGPGSTIGDDFSFRDYFQNALHTTRPLVSQGRISPTTQEAVATAVMPLWSPEGEFLGLVGANIRLQSLNQTLKAIASEQDTDQAFQIIILDSADQIIAYADDKFLLHPAGDLLPVEYFNTLFEENHTFIHTGPDGEERLYTHAHIRDIGWHVIVSRPTSVAFATQIFLQRIAIIAAATFLLIGVIFWLTLTYRVILPIERLAPISEAIGLNQALSREERNHLTRESLRSDQIGHLIRSIIKMEDSIARACGSKPPCWRQARLLFPAWTWKLCWIRSWNKWDVC